MNDVLKQHIKATAPMFNKDVTRNLAKLQLERAQTIATLRQIIKFGLGVSNENVANIRFELLDISELSPAQACFANINASSSKNTIQISRDSVIHINIKLGYDVPNGTSGEIDKVIAIPALTPDGILEISGTEYNVTAVLSNYPVSKEIGGVFIRILRDKVNVKQMNRQMLVNGVKTTRPIHYANTYKLISDVSPTVPLIPYIFTKYGMFNWFKSKLGIEIEVYDTHKEIPDSNIYTIYTTQGKEPTRYPKKTNEIYTPHKVGIKVKTIDIAKLDEDKQTTLETMICGIMYSFDMSPFHANQILKLEKKDIKGPKDTYTISTYRSKKELLFWYGMIGRIIFKNKYTIERLVTDMNEHMVLLANYIDINSRKKLIESGIYINDFFELLEYIVVNYDRMVLVDDDNKTAIYDRYYESPYYIMYGIVVALNKIFLDLKRASDKSSQGNKAILSEHEMRRIINKHLGMKKIYSLTKSSALNLALNPIDVTTDNVLFKRNLNVVSQTQGIGVLKSNKKNSKFPADFQTLNGYMIYTSSLLSVTKSALSPISHINPYAKIDLYTGRYVIDKKTQKTITALDALLSRHTDALDGVEIHE